MPGKRREQTRRDLMRISNRDARELLLALSDQGWKIRTTGANRFRVVSPRGDSWTVPRSPNDRRAIQNSVAKLRKLGADL